ELLRFEGEVAFDGPVATQRNAERALRDELGVVEVRDEVGVVVQPAVTEADAAVHFHRRRRGGVGGRDGGAERERAQRRRRKVCKLAHGGLNLNRSYESCASVWCSVESAVNALCYALVAERIC